MYIESYHVCTLLELLTFGVLYRGIRYRDRGTLIAVLLTTTPLKEFFFRNGVQVLYSPVLSQSLCFQLVFLDTSTTIACDRRLWIIPYTTTFPDNSSGLYFPSQLILPLCVTSFVHLVLSRDTSRFTPSLV